MRTVFLIPRRFLLVSLKTFGRHFQNIIRIIIIILVPPITLTIGTTRDHVGVWKTWYCAFQSRPLWIAIHSSDWAMEKREASTRPFCAPCLLAMLTAIVRWRSRRIIVTQIRCIPHGFANFGRSIPNRNRKTTSYKVVFPPRMPVITFAFRAKRAKVFWRGNTRELLHFTPNALYSTVPPKICSRVWYPRGASWCCPTTMTTTTTTTTQSTNMSVWEVVVFLFLNIWLFFPTSTNSR